jgi:hypothetical protein
MTEVPATETPAKVKKPKYEGPACSVCNKPLKDPDSIKAGIGPLCRAKGWTKEAVAAKMAQLKRDTIPDGWLKLADLDKLLRKEGIPVARMVKAVGGDRGMEEPAHPMFQVAYVGRARYLSPECFTDAGLNILRDKYLGKPAPEKKPRAKKEKDPNAPAKAKKPAKVEATAEVPNLDDAWNN